MSQVRSIREPDESRVARAYVQRLRQKLRKSADNSRYILTSLASVTGWERLKSGWCNAETSGTANRSGGVYDLRHRYSRRWLVSADGAALTLPGLAGYDGQRDRTPSGLEAGSDHSLRRCRRSSLLVCRRRWLPSLSPVTRQFRYSSAPLMPHPVSPSRYAVAWSAMQLEQDPSPR